MNNTHSLYIKNLTVKTQHRLILDGVSLMVPLGDSVAIVGESGSGKTTLAMSLLRLLPPGMDIKAEQLEVNGKSILSMGHQEMARLRGEDIGVIFQEPLAAFDPLLTMGFHWDEALRVHTSLNPSQRRQRIHEVLTLVGLPSVREVIHRYPHQLSGGQRQRAMMALACICYPSLLIADEPTSNLDTLVQEQVIRALRHLHQHLKMTLVMITHDLGLARQVAHHLVVLKEGRIMEAGPIERVIHDPQHPYTRQLMEASLG